MISSSELKFLMGILKAYAEAINPTEIKHTFLPRLSGLYVYVT